jgi:hypothetical protein
MQRRANIPKGAYGARGNSSRGARRAQFDPDVKRLKQLSMREACLHGFAFNMRRATVSSKEVEERGGRLYDQVTKATSVANGWLNVLTKLERSAACLPESAIEAISKPDSRDAFDAAIDRLSPAQYDNLLRSIRRPTQSRSDEKQPSQTGSGDKSALNPVQHSSALGGSDDPAVDEIIRRVEEEQLRTENVITATVKRIWASRYIRIPVPVREFVTGSRYLNLSPGSDSTLTSALDGLEALHRGEYGDVVLVGDNASVNTDFAAMAVAYDLYVLSCMRDPAATYGLRTNSNITFLNVSSTMRSARTGFFSFLNDMVRRTWYFNQVFPFDRRTKTELRFRKNIHCYPVAASEQGVLAVGAFSAVIEEPELMDTTSRSKRATPSRGSTYDQARAVYDKLRMRIWSRFAMNGKVPGRIYVLSSAPRRPGGLIERLLEQARKESEEGKQSVFVLSS